MANDKSEPKAPPTGGIDISTMRPFLEGLLRNMQGGVFVVDRARKIMSFNKAAEWITGYCLNDVLGKDCCEIMRGKVCEEACPLERVLHTGGPVFRNEVEILSKEGAPIPVSITAFGLKNIHGETVGMVELIRDLTELQALRGQLIQSEKMALMGRLAAGVAHEVNNPIAGILTYLKLLIRKLDKGGDANHFVPEFRKYLAMMEREVGHIGRIVRNLLDFARPGEPDMRAVQVNEIIQQSLALVQDQLKMGNVEVDWSVRDGLPEIVGDFNQLQQVFVNLLLNAVQAMSEGGKLLVRTEAEGTPGQECFVNVEVTDTGCGIAEVDLPKIFDPFYTTKVGKDGMGLGLGLSIVQGIVKSHHGGIYVKSTPGKGTSFRVRLST